MVVAAHISSVFKTSQLLHALEFLAAHNPSIQFIILTDAGSVTEKEVAMPNMQLTPVKPIKSNLRLHYWYNFSLPSLLKKYKADLFISEEGICSSRAGIPQYLWINNTSFLDRKSVYRFKKDSYQRRNFLKFVQQSRAVLVAEKYMAGQVLAHYGLPEEKFHFAGEYFFNLYKPIESGSKEALLKDIDDGIEYFYCECNAATRHNITTLLKAFSLFKKRLKSGLKLVLFLNKVSLEDCVKDFRLYKYREDVIVKGTNDKDYSPAELIAASYAVIHLPEEITGSAETGLQAMLSAVPVIAADTAEHHSLYGEAALFSKINEQGIADNMMLLYKDEHLRARHIEKGLALAGEHTLSKMAGRLWQTILATMPEKAQ